MFLYNPIAVMKENAHYVRWHVYDTVTHLIYGKSTDMVQNDCDVDGLIGEWHHEFTLGGMVATLPWLVVPIIKNPWLKRFLMPTKGNSTGSGHIMSVREGSYSRLNFWSSRGAGGAKIFFSGTKGYSNIVWRILNWLIKAIWLTGECMLLFKRIALMSLYTASCKQSLLTAQE